MHVHMRCPCGRTEEARVRLVVDEEQEPRRSEQQRCQGDAGGAVGGKRGAVGGMRGAGGGTMPSPNLQAA